MTTVIQNQPFTMIGVANGAFSASGNVRYSNVASGAPSWQTPGGSVTVSVSGDTATISGLVETATGTFRLDMEDTVTLVSTYPANSLTYTCVAGAVVGGTGAVALMMLRLANP